MTKARASQNVQAPPLVGRAFCFPVGCSGLLLIFFVSVALPAYAILGSGAGGHGVPRPLEYEKYFVPAAPVLFIGICLVAAAVGILRQRVWGSILLIGSLVSILVVNGIYVELRRQWWPSYIILNKNLTYFLMKMVATASPVTTAITLFSLLAVLRRFLQARRKDT